MLVAAVSHLDERCSVLFVRLLSCGVQLPPVGFAFHVWLRRGNERAFPVEENFFSVLLQLSIPPRRSQVLVEEGSVEMQPAVHAARVAEGREQIGFEAAHAGVIGT